MAVMCSSDTATEIYLLDLWDLSFKSLAVVCSNDFCHFEPQTCIAGRRDGYKAPPNEATYICLGKRSNDLSDFFIRHTQ